LKNYYELLGVRPEASTEEIKKAFREKAKRHHPDIVGSPAGEEMRRLLSAYEVLSNTERRYEYDRAYSRFVKKAGFNYRVWLREQEDDPSSQAKLMFFELLHMEEGEAINIWRRNGGLMFQVEKYLDREDWMDCLFILAEELDRRHCGYEAFRLFSTLLKEERKRPYFRHFTVELESRLKDLARLRLKAQVDEETWIDCLEILLSLGFPSREELRWKKDLAKAYELGGRSRQAPDEAEADVSVSGMAVAS
jgi:curved DNA-binding protein CbpA